jgi:pimeloyl-ACP methyl ester carboxylesterase
MLGSAQDYCILHRRLSHSKTKKLNDYCISLQSNLGHFLAQKLYICAVYEQMKQCKILIVLFFLFGGCTSYVTEGSLFNPSHYSISVRDSIGLGGTHKQNIELEVAPNTILRGYRISKLDSKGVLLYFGGNGGSISTVRQFLDSLCITLNAETFCFDWRGYGFSDGTPSMRVIMQDALNVFDYVDKATNGSAPIVIGRSLGSGIATYVASLRHPRSLILLSPPSDLNRVIQEWSHFSSWYERPFVRVRADDSLRALHPQPIEAAKQIVCPTLIVAGEQDQLIPPSFSKELYDSLVNVEKKQYLILPNVNHYNLDILSSPVSGPILSFIGKK